MARLGKRKSNNRRNAISGTRTQGGASHHIHKKQGDVNAQTLRIDAAIGVAWVVVGSFLTVIRQWIAVVIAIVSAQRAKPEVEESPRLALDRDGSRRKVPCCRR